MNPKRTFQVAMEGLTLNKVRSFLTTLGIIIGVAAVIVMLAVSAGAEAEIADQINSLGANLIMVTAPRTQGGLGPGTGSSLSLEYDDIAAIQENVTGINGVSAEQSTTQDLKVGTTILEDISIVGTTSGFTDVRDYQILAGRFLTDEDNDRSNRVVTLGYDIAVELFGSSSTGSEQAADSAVGQQVKIGSTNFTVVGVMAEKGVVGTTDYDGRVYIPLTVVFDRYMSAMFGSGTIRLLYVSAESSEVMDSMSSQVVSLLNERHDADAAATSFTVMTQDSIIDTQASTTEAFRNLLGWVAGVSLMVGGIGIMNIMLVSVTERTREIGLRQALGARPRDVRLQFLIEAVVLSLIGGVVGVLVGVGGAYLFNALGTMRTELVTASIPLAFAAAAAVGIFFGYYPAVKAAQLDPIEALRRE